MSLPLFSIVIPSLNRAHTIGRAIESCLEQTCQDFEIIVIDDEQSSDNMASVLEQYKSQCALSLITDHQGSAAAARNTGINEAKGQYIAFLDADDLYMPSKLATVAKLLDSEPRTLFYSQNYIDRGVDKWWIKPRRGLAVDENIFNYLFLGQGWVHPSSMVLATDLAKKNPFDTALSFGDDTQFVADLWLQGVKVTMIEAPLTLYDDPYQSDRLSQSPVFKSGKSDEHVSFMHWVESQRSEMPEPAYRAYRASFRSRFFARRSPLNAMRDIWQAWRYGVFTCRQCLSQTLQTFSPGIYRRVADLVVHYRGVEPVKRF